MDDSIKTMTTKVFMNGRSQAVRIPVEYRFEESELFINKLVRTMEQGIDMIPEDFMADGRPDEIQAKRENL